MRGVKWWEGEEARRHPKERSQEGRLVDILRRDWIGNISMRWSVLIRRGDMYIVQERDQDWKLSS